MELPIEIEKLLAEEEARGTSKTVVELCVDICCLELRIFQLLAFMDSAVFNFTFFDRVYNYFS